MLFVLLIIASIIAFGQRPAYELTFTAVNNTTHVQMDSIKVLNRTQGGDTVLYYPDTVLTIYYVGLSEITKKMNGFQVFQNYPNPVADQTTISINVPEKDKVSMAIMDLLGRVILRSGMVLEKGTHSFRFTPGPGSLFFFSAEWRGSNSSIKILQTSCVTNRPGSLEYIGGEISSPQLKVMRDIRDFIYAPGDTLLFIGYTDTIQSGILDNPEESHTYTFQFATNIPCLGMSIVEYGSRVYNTIQIFSQCWLKENLNAGIMIPGSQWMTDNGVIEKYCYDDDTNNCNIYGALYWWDEMMQYVTQQGVQGICPPGWHIPTDEEWKVLEGAVDSQYGIGDSIWDYNGERGLDAGTNLKATNGWYYGGNGTDLFGFSGLPGGYHDSAGFFALMGEDGNWWLSNEDNISYAYGRTLVNWNEGVDRWTSWYKAYSFSVRCLRD